MLAFKMRNAARFGPFRTALGIEALQWGRYTVKTVIKLKILLLVHEHVFVIGPARGRRQYVFQGAVAPPVSRFRSCGRHGGITIQQKEERGVGKVDTSLHGGGGLAPVGA